MDSLVSFLVRLLFFAASWPPFACYALNLCVCECEWGGKSGRWGPPPASKCCLPEENSIKRARRNISRQTTMQIHCASVCVYMCPLSLSRSAAADFISSAGANIKNVILHSSPPLLCSFRPSLSTSRYLPCISPRLKMSPWFASKKIISFSEQISETNFILIWTFIYWPKAFLIDDFFVSDADAGRSKSWPFSRRSWFNSIGLPTWDKIVSFTLEKTIRCFEADKATKELLKEARSRDLF